MWPLYVIVHHHVPIMWPLYAIVHLLFLLLQKLVLILHPQVIEVIWVGVELQPLPPIVTVIGEHVEVWRTVAGPVGGRHKHMGNKMAQIHLPVSFVSCFRKYLLVTWNCTLKVTVTHCRYRARAHGMADTRGEVCKTARVYYCYNSVSQYSNLLYK